MHFVKLGPRCNNGCVFCAQHGELQSSAVDDLVADSLRLVSPGEDVAFVGGEPTLHANLLRWVSQAKARGARRIWLQTNGRRLAYRPYVQLLADAGVNHLDISVHGTTAPMHDYHVAVEGAFGQTCRGIRNARAAGLHVVVTCVWTRSNYRHTLEMVKLVRTLGARALRCRMPLEIGRAKIDRARVVPQPALVEPYAMMARRYANAVKFPLVAIWEGDVETSDNFVDFVADSAEEAGTDEPGAADDGEVRVKKVRPAKEEKRVNRPLTGVALRDVLPSLFDDDGEDGHG